MNFKEIDKKLKEEFDLSNVKLETYYNKFDYFSEAVYFYAKRQTVTQLGLSRVLNCRLLAMIRALEYLKVKWCKNYVHPMTYEEADMSLLWLKEIQEALTDVRKTITIDECKDYKSQNFYFDDSPASAKRKHKEVTMFVSATFEFLYVKRGIPLRGLQNIVKSEIKFTSIDKLLKKLQIEFRPKGGANNKKFTDEQVIEIRNKRKKGKKLEVLAEEYETNISTMALLCSHKTYKHVK